MMHCMYMYMYMYYRSIRQTFCLCYTCTVLYLWDYTCGATVLSVGEFVFAILIAVAAGSLIILS